MAPQLIDFLSSPFLSLFSHLVALFIAGCVSGGSPFRHVCHSRCVELVSWSFGLFYSELCDSSLAMSAFCSGQYLSSSSLNLANVRNYISLDRGWLHSLLIFCSLIFSLCSLISLHFSSLDASPVAFHFAMFATPGLDSVFLRVCGVSLLEL
ncbi:hypothetical protein DY000_02003286 [Brassica cretica]|uniref:Uncharacterized protein n=1 Tax=Brassica cretica TaxID=69181 RepID=A0ABQ7C3W9_BRACR|nr:hypothetical protein DY000_02003286 [Brassica cretica]